jgi:predicted ester cyclase
VALRARMAGTLGGVSVRGEIEQFYRRYNAICNTHHFGRLGEFVAERVVVNGEAQTLAG